MDNLFYTPPETVDEASSIIVIEGQEVQHISRVLRHKTGDHIVIADGTGIHYKSEIISISKKNLAVSIISKLSEPEPLLKKVLAFGSIRKRDRLEFAIEKSVELGAWEIVLFNADHSERSRINKERIETQVISAFKQSRRYWLPRIQVLDSLDEVYPKYKQANYLMAHVDAGLGQQPASLKKGENILFVGPEGGFSSREKELHLSKGGKLVSLGSNRLRAETAAAAFLSQYLFTD